MKKYVRAMAFSIFLVQAVALSGCENAGGDAPTTEPVAEKILDGGDAPTTEPVAEKILDGAETPTTEPVAEKILDGAEAPTTEPVAEKILDGAEAPATEPAAEKIDDGGDAPVSGAEAEDETLDGDDADMKGTYIELEGPGKSGPPGTVAEGRELISSADSEEEARRIAELYGIEFVEYSYGVASYHTEEDLQDVIKRGKQKGWPELSVNNIINLF